MKHALAALLLLAPLTALAGGTPKPTAFTLVSPDLHDGAIMKTENAGVGKAADGSECGGQNVSPALLWKNAPAGTQSFAITMFDPDGQGMNGVSHWVSYDYPATMTHLSRGDGTKEGIAVGGSNMRKLATYFGPCPPVGGQYHHYTIQIFALSIPPGTLAPGLTRAELATAVAGKVLAQTSLVFRYTR